MSILDLVDEFSFDLLSSWKMQFLLNLKNEYRNPKLMIIPYNHICISTLSNKSHDLGGFPEFCTHDIIVNDQTSIMSWGTFNNQLLNLSCYQQSIPMDKSQANDIPKVTEGLAKWGLHWEFNREIYTFKIMNLCLEFSHQHLSLNTWNHNSGS